MGVFGSLGGSALGKKIGGDGIFGDILGGLGGIAGGLLPYETGGYVVKTTPALLHAGEFVLPANAEPTMAQRRIVNRNQAKDRMKNIRFV
tara:strand:- start:727 stop:996 length:270 start_codon:yes stop_codon:yes gene_type:complete